MLSIFIAAVLSQAPAPVESTTQDQLTIKTINGVEWGYTQRYGWGRVTRDPALGKRVDIYLQASSTAPGELPNVQTVPTESPVDVPVARSAPSVVRAPVKVVTQPVAKPVARTDDQTADDRKRLAELVTPNNQAGKDRLKLLLERLESLESENQALRQRLSVVESTLPGAL